MTAANFVCAVYRCTENAASNIQRDANCCTNASSTISKACASAFAAPFGALFAAVAREVPCVLLSVCHSVHVAILESLDELFPFHIDMTVIVSVSVGFKVLLCLFVGIV